MMGSMNVDDVMRRAAAAGRWRAPDLSERRAVPVLWTGGTRGFGLDGRVVGDPPVIWYDGGTTRASELADPDGGWEPIGDDVTPVEPAPIGTKRWFEALALRHTGVEATARHARPGVVLIELAGEPRLGGVDMLIGEATLGRRVAVEVTWTKTVDGPVW
jgi:hypothetical protein